MNAFSGLYAALEGKEVKHLVLNWQKLLSDAKLLSFLEKVADKKIESVTPSVSQSGEIVYPAIGEASLSEAVRILDALATEGVLERKSETMILGCPTHEGSLDLVPRLKCPHCSSMLLKKGTLLQHSCGFVGNQEVFVESCPKCGRPAPAQTLRIMGTWYECGSCKQRFAAPNVYLYCKKFDHDFPLQNAVLVDKPSYNLTTDAEKDLKGRVGMIIFLKRGIESSGGAVEVFGSMPGASGVQHMFDLVIQLDGSKIPVDVKFATDTPVGVAAVLATYAKALDTKSKPSVLVAIPTASDDARKSAQAYGMVIIEGTEGKLVLELLNQALEKAKSEIPKVSL